MIKAGIEQIKKLSPGEITLVAGVTSLGVERLVVLVVSLSGEEKPRESSVINWINEVPKCGAKLRRTNLIEDLR
ncbi:MAG: hypothetical protein ACE5IT_08295 [bacterium]